MALSIFSRILVAVMSILRVGLAIAIIIITAQQLYHIDFWFSHNGQIFAYRAHCLMAGDVRGQNVCDYTYAVCGLSMLLSLLTSIFLCITCDMCGVGSWLEFAVEGFQTAWWIIAGIVITKKVRDSNEVTLDSGDGLPKENWRNAVAVMTWVAALLSLLIALVYLGESIKALAKCCGWCKGKDKDDSSHGGDHHHRHHKKGGDEATPVYYGEQPVPPPQPGQPPAPQAVGEDAAVRANAV